MLTRRVLFLSSLAWIALLFSALKSYAVAEERDPSKQEDDPRQYFSMKYMSTSIVREIGSVTIIVEDELVTLHSYSPEGDKSSCQLESSPALKQLWTSRPSEATWQEIRELREEIKLLVAELVAANSVPDGIRILALLRPVSGVHMSM